MDTTATPRGFSPRRERAVPPPRPRHDLRRRSVARSKPSVSRPSARLPARPGGIPKSNASSARSAASVWTTSSSSMSGIFVESFGPTSRTTSGLARTSRSARMLRWHAPSNRPAASWCDPKSAVCATATNGKPPDRACLHRRATVAWTWRSACELGPRHLQNGIRPPALAMATRAVERRFLGELIAMENRLSRGYGDGHPHP